MKLKKFIPLIIICVLLAALITVTVSSNLLGDTDGDGLVTSADARRVLRYAAELDEKLSPRELRAADINLDGIVKANDARSILLAAAEIEEIPTFPGTVVNTYSNDFCVEIHTKHDNGSYSQGSGFFIKEDGVIVTNYHCIAEGVSAEVLTYDMEWHEVTNILAYSARYDLAVIKADCECPYYADIDTRLPEVGDKIYALGSPNGQSFTFSEGKIMELNHYMDEFRYVDWIVFDAATAPGSSGCPLINSKGVVIGINSREELLEEGEMNYAVPASYLDELEYFDHPLNFTEFRRRDYRPSGLSCKTRTLELGKGESAVVTFIVKDMQDVILNCNYGKGIDIEWGSWYQDCSMIDLTITCDGSDLSNPDDTSSYLSVFVEGNESESVYISVKFR